LEGSDPKWRRRLELVDLPQGVADGVEQTLMWNVGDVRFGVVATGTPFWEWLAGKGFIHVWTYEKTSGATDAVLESMLRNDSVDVVLFDYVFPRSGHAVWSTIGVKIVVWYRGTSNICLPLGWKLHSILVWHSEIGGVTDGVFHV
jgi:hypothetical protein